MTIYKCDRCGEGIDRGHGAAGSVEVDLPLWKGDGSRDVLTERLRLTLKAEVPAFDYDEPDLCQSCFGELVMQAGSKIYSEAKADKLAKEAAGPKEG